MDLNLLKDFLVAYSLPTVIIAFASAVAVIILGVILKDKLSISLKNYLPFIFSILAYIAYDMIKLKAFILREDTLYAGILSGSVSSVICSFISKLIKGEAPDLNSTVFLIEGLLKGYVHDDKLYITALALDNLFAQNTDDESLEGCVNQLLKDNSLEHCNQEDLLRLTTLIIQTIKSLKN